VSERLSPHDLTDTAALAIGQKMNKRHNRVACRKIFTER